MPENTDFTFRQPSAEELVSAGAGGGLIVGRIDRNIGANGHRRGDADPDLSPPGSFVVARGGNTVVIGPCRTWKTVGLTANLICPEVEIDPVAEADLLKRLLARARRRLSPRLARSGVRKTRVGFTSPVMMFDRSGEVLASTILARLRLGRKVAVIDPDGLLKGLAKKPGFEYLSEVPTVGFEPLNALPSEDHPRFALEVERLAESFIGSDRHRCDVEATACAQVFLAGLIAFVARLPLGDARRSIAFVGSLLHDEALPHMLSGEPLPEWTGEDGGFLPEWREWDLSSPEWNDRAGGLPSRASARYRNLVASGHSVEADAAIMICRSALSWLRSPGIQDCLAAPAFDFADFIEGRSDLFVLFSFIENSSHGRGHLAALAECAFMTARVRPGRMVDGGIDVILDDAPEVGRVPGVVDAFNRTGYQIHVRAHIVAQSESMLEAAYGPDVVDRMFANAETVSFRPQLSSRDERCHEMFGDWHRDAAFLARARDWDTFVARPGMCARARMGAVRDLAAPEFRGLALPHSLFDRDALPSPQVLAELRARLAAAGTNGIAG